MPDIATVTRTIDHDLPETARKAIRERFQFARHEQLWREIILHELNIAVAHRYLALALAPAAGPAELDAGG